MEETKNGIGPFYCLICFRKASALSFVWGWAAASAIFNWISGGEPASTLAAGAQADERKIPAAVPIAAQSGNAPFRGRRWVRKDASLIATGYFTPGESPLAPYFLNTPHHPPMFNGRQGGRGLPLRVDYHRKRYENRFFEEVP